MTTAPNSRNRRVWRSLRRKWPMAIAVLWLALLSRVVPFASQAGNLDDIALRHTARVIASDDRQSVEDTTESPWRMVGQIQGWWGSQGFSGTGVLIGPDWVLTAAHCVYRSDLGGWADRVVFIPARDGMEWPFGGATAIDMAIPQPYAEREDRAVDVALVTLDEPLGEDTGWMDVADPDLDPTRLTADSAGYPSDKPGQTMYWTVGSTGLLVDGMLRTAIDAGFGQSGSPLWIYDEEPVVVAVLAAELDNGAANLAVPVDTALIAQLAARSHPAVASSAVVAGATATDGDTQPLLYAPAASMCGLGVAPMAAVGMLALAGMRTSRRRW